MTDDSWSKAVGFEGCDAQDNFEHSLWHYVKALQVLSHDAETQCEEMGNYNTPWEIQHDVGEAGLYLIRPKGCYLTGEQTETIAELSAALLELPEEAIAPAEMLMTSHAGCIYAMSHPAWEPAREGAKRLLELLEPAIRKNAAYFQE
jgi:hypothetical protein